MAALKPRLGNAMKTHSTFTPMNPEDMGWKYLMVPLNNRGAAHSVLKTHVLYSFSEGPDEFETPGLHSVAI